MTPPTERDERRGPQLQLLAVEPEPMEVHCHYVLDRRGAYDPSEVVHSHEGGDRPHTHPGMGPASFTIDKDAWYRATGLVGGGRKRYTDTPEGPQHEFVEIPPEHLRMEVYFHPSANAKAEADGAIGAGPAPVARMILSHGLRPNLRLLS